MSSPHATSLRRRTYPRSILREQPLQAIQWPRTAPHQRILHRQHRIRPPFLKRTSQRLLQLLSSRIKLQIQMPHPALIADGPSSAHSDSFIKPSHLLLTVKRITPALALPQRQSKSMQNAFPTHTPIAGRRSLPWFFAPSSSGRTLGTVRPRYACRVRSWTGSRRSYSSRRRRIRSSPS